MIISIMTSEESFLNNYGAALQGYALSTVIKHMGHSVSIIRYAGSSPSDHLIKTKLRRLASKMYHVAFKRKKENDLYRKEKLIQQKKFEKFQTEHMIFWNKRRVSWPTLQKKYQIADAYICGSDQIWNPYYKKGYNDPGYFLDFVPAAKKRIAYAPSFGCDDIPVTAQKDLKYYLDKFNSISVREQEGANIIEKYANLKVPVNADPTFLLTQEEWNTIAKMPADIPPKYILCYRFMPNKDMTACMEQLRLFLGIPIITLPLSEMALKDNYIKRFDAGPSEFIGLIKNASVVCTDSFHATAFSLIMNIPFFTFLDNDEYGKGTNMNSRIRNLIQMSGLVNRVIKSKEDFNPEFAFDVDFTIFNHNCAESRDISLSWLSEALQGEQR